MFPFSYNTSISISSDFQEFKQRFLQLILNHHLEYEQSIPKVEQNELSSVSYIQEFKHKFQKQILNGQRNDKNFPPIIKETETCLLIKIKKWECLQYPFLKQDFEQLNFLSKIKLNYNQLDGNSEVVIKLRYRLLWCSFFAHILLALFFIALPVYQIYSNPQDSVGTSFWVVALCVFTALSGFFLFMDFKKFQVCRNSVLKIINDIKIQEN